MKKAFVQLHLAVFLAGFTGPLGKLITLNEGLLVWYRLLISAVALWILALLGRRSFALPAKDIVRIFGVGAIAALHWVSFYGSIKLSNVSIGLLCFSSIGFFTAILEPLLFRKKPDMAELLLGIMVILGIYFIFRIAPGYKAGILTGILSAFLGSIFPILNRKLLRRIPYREVTLYELTGGFLFLTLILPLYLHGKQIPSFWPDIRDWGWLLVLSLICTVWAFNLSMSALRSISAFTVNLTYNLEPIYGIALAFLIFREDKYFSSGFYLGFSLIMFAILLQMWRVWRMEKNVLPPRGPERRQEVPTGQ